MFGAWSAFTIAMGLVRWFHNHRIVILCWGFLSVSLTACQWWRDVIRERTYQGHHTFPVIKGLKWGITYFIASEVIFFFSFFWAFFHRYLAPAIQIGAVWPPSGIQPFDPISVPLLNTALLISSGVSVTWAHHAILGRKKKEAITALIITIVQGVLFTFFQAYEYWVAPFTIADSIYGSVFFVATGFHGLHVLIGTTFLLVCLVRLDLNHFSSKHHVGFEVASWYWHFVDVVWIFLYICVYWSTNLSYFLG